MPQAGAPPPHSGLTVQVAECPLSKAQPSHPLIASPLSPVSVPWSPAESDQLELRQTGPSVLDLAPSVSPASHKRALPSRFLLPATRSVTCWLYLRGCAFTAAAGAGVAPEESREVAGFYLMSSNLPAIFPFFLPLFLVAVRVYRVGELGSGSVVVSWKELPTLALSSNQPPTSLILVPS